MKQLNIKSFLIVALFIFIIIGLVTNLVAGFTYPAWEDEAVLSDIAYNYYNFSTWKLDIIPNEGNAWIYGPIYFNIQNVFIKLFGFTPFSLRLTNGIATYLVLISTIYIISKEVKNNIVIIIVAILLVVDSSFNRAITVGRMDMLATLFSLLGLVFALKYNDNRLKNLILAALFSCFAYLTTPRALFLLPSNFVIILFYLIKELKISSTFKYQFLNILIATCFFIIPILFWIQSVGGVSHYIEYLNSSNHISKHKGITLFRDKEDYIFIPLFFITTYFYIRNTSPSKLFISLFISLIFFTLFVKEVGPYRPMIMPYFYILLTIGCSSLLNLKKISKSYSFLLKVVFFIFFSISFSFFSYRTIDVLLVNRNCRNADYLKKTLFRNIPNNKSIAIDYDYYFLFKKKYKSIQEFSYLKEVYYETKILPDYLVLNQNSNEFLKNSNEEWYIWLKENYNIVGQYNCEANEFSAFKSRRNYNGTIVYVKKNLNNFKKT
jgi:hypothetical protein